MRFYNWMMTQLERPESHFDFVREAQCDSDFPKRGSLLEIGNYLSSLAEWPKIQNPFLDVWSEWAAQNYGELNSNERFFLEAKQIFENSTGRPGYLYVVASKLLRVYKIGRTSSLDSLNKRIAAIGTYTPGGCNLITTLLCDDVFVAEQYFHLLYQSCHVSGEWFQLSDDDVEALRKKSNEWNSRDELSELIYAHCEFCFGI